MTDQMRPLPELRRNIARVVVDPATTHREILFAVIHSMALSKNRGERKAAKKIVRVLSKETTDGPAEEE